MFLEAQGYQMQESFLEQDNESAIKLEKNGRTSAGPKSRHINIRYFWIKDRLKSERVVVRHCPTLAMLADFFTKPLQGHLFRTFRDVLLGHEHVDSLSTSLIASTTKERVGDSVFVRREKVTTGVVDTVDTSTVRGTVAKLTWADVVKKAPKVATAGMCGGDQSQDSGKHRKPVLRSLSQNNPVNRIKV